MLAWWQYLSIVEWIAAFFTAALNVLLFLLDFVWIIGFLLFSRFMIFFFIIIVFFLVVFILLFLVFLSNVLAIISSFITLNRFIALIKFIFTQALLFNALISWGINCNFRHLFFLELILSLVVLNFSHYLLFLLLWWGWLWWLIFLLLFCYYVMLSHLRHFIITCAFISLALVFFIRIFITVTVIAIFLLLFHFILSLFNFLISHLFIKFHSWVWLLISGRSWVTTRNLRVYSQSLINSRSFTNWGLSWSSHFVFFLLIGNLLIVHV